MLDLIRKGCQKVVRFFLGGKGSPGRDVGERTGTASPVLARVEVSHDKEVRERPRQEIPVTIHPNPPVSASMEVSLDKDVVKCTGTTHPVDSLSPPSVPAAPTAPPFDFSRWIITESLESPFEKVGRLYIEGDDLVIRSDLDTRGFRIPLADVVDVLDGNPRPVLLLAHGTHVGVAKRSASGRAMNVVIAPYLYTSPLARVMDVLEGRARKAAVFVGREVVEG